MTAPIISVIIATYDRPTGLRRLLGDLARQAIAAHAFEVIVVDDGSALPAIAAVADAVMPSQTRFVRIANSGPGAARDAGARQARGVVIVFVDDDMRVAPDFLAAHLGQHWTGGVHRVVLGNIQADPALASMPLFERFHAQQLSRFQRDAVAGRLQPRGVHLCTGNVSMRLADYLGVGGFDTTLRRSEDRDLGIRLEQNGCAFVFGVAAVTVHGSDHRDVKAWRRRSVEWARADLQIAERHPSVADVHPWRFWSLIDPRARPLVSIALALPTLGRVLGAATYALARSADLLGRTSLALRLTTLTYALDYFRGLRLTAGGLRAVRRVRQTAATAATPTTPKAIAQPTPAAPAATSMRNIAHGVRADHAHLRQLRSKYHGDVVSERALLGHLVRKIGFQMLAVYRVMHWAHQRRVPLVAPVISRLIRHLYGAEINWQTQIAPGVSIVHGNGLVLSAGTVIGTGCVLFQGVTIGESYDALTGRIGAPHLEANVHVGPNAVLIGPITIGAGSKILAGTVVTQDVPAGSLVRGPESLVSPRGAPAAA
jgi:serine acetyltransferase/glycosyltransferase involved in cell wall biosynthesis